MKKSLPFIYLLSSISAFAAGNPQDIQLGYPEHAGSGCPIGSLGASLTPDKKTLSLLFDQYSVQAGNPTGLSFERKGCNVSIPVHVPQGLSISLISVDYRGKNILPSGASSKFKVEYFFAGSRGPIVSKTYNGPTNDDFLIQTDLGSSNNVWSQCGQDVILRMSTGLDVYTNGSREQAYSSLDSADVSAAIVYKLQWKTCR